MVVDKESDKALLRAIYILSYKEVVGINLVTSEG
tara:strand:- start:278 stop:379 length:102 start_codon:yes stop_codon:yes gene_type:complete